MFRLGSRSDNGRYDLTDPSGGTIAGKGIKLSNAKLNTGDPVQVLQRQDGIYVILGPIANRETEQPTPIQRPALADKCDGYTRGQVFNCPVVEEKDVVTAWAIGTFPIGSQDLGISLINLISGNTYFLVSIPNNIQPCTAGNPPPGPPPPDPPPTEGGDLTYMHTWVRVGNFQPPFQPPHCSINAPVPTRPDTLLTDTTTINLVHPIDGTSWFSRSAGGRYSDLPPSDPDSGWGSNALSTFSADPSPPPLPAGVAMPVVSTGYIDYSNGSFLTPINPATVSRWIYASTTCIPAPYNPDNNPGLNPNYNRQPPPAPTIPNTNEMTLSLDSRGNPIAFIRHTPSCVRQGDWASKRSYRVVNGQVRSYLGKLRDDWRYTVPAFTCQSTFAADLFTNLDRQGQLWDVEAEDRPASIVVNAPPLTIPAKQRRIQPNCSTTNVRNIDVRSKAVEPGSRTYNIRAIAIKVKKQKKA